VLASIETTKRNDERNKKKDRRNASLPETIEQMVRRKDQEGERSPGQLVTSEVDVEGIPKLSVTKELYDGASVEAVQSRGARSTSSRASGPRDSSRPDRRSRPATYGFCTYCSAAARSAE
jgi:hypothetical protein